MKQALALTALAVAACSAPAPQDKPTCSATLASDGTADLVLAGSDACPSTLRLALRVATGDPDAPTWGDVASAPITIGGEWTSAGATATRTVTATNHTAQPVALVALEWSDPAPQIAGATVLLHNGYQSWSYTGIEAIPPSLSDGPRGTAPHGGDNEDLVGEMAGVSWWWTAIADARGQGAVIGATSGNVLKTYVAVEQHRLRVVQGATGDALTLMPGETRTLDGLFVALGDINGAFGEYARAVLPPGETPPRAAGLQGWGSWNFYYAAPTAQAIRDEAQFAAQTLAPLGLTDFLLDDGYESHWGSWQAAPAFGADLATLNQEQAKAGLRPAVWLAPFYVQVDDPVVQQHGEWFVHRRDGTLRTYQNFGPTYAALDVTHPDARAFVVAAVQRYRDWGYRTLKIDFLFGGAIEGVRQQPVTALESYALWMKTLREAVPGIHLVGCGAPMLPSVGRVDSMRIGADIAFVNEPAPRYPFIAAAARNTILRSFTDGWWRLDPDVVLLRGDAIDDATAWTAVLVAALAGGNYLAGDARQASPLRRAMLLDPEVLALARSGSAAAPIDTTAQLDDRLWISPLLDVSGETAIPHAWSKDRLDPGQTPPAVRDSWLAAFGWSDGATIQATFPSGGFEVLPPSAPGQPATRVPVAAGDVMITVPPHAARLFVQSKE